MCLLFMVGGGNVAFDVTRLYKANTSIMHRWMEARQPGFLV